MTFKEFFDLIGSEHEQLRQDAILHFKEDGFTEEQINNLKMEKFYKYLIDIGINYLDLIGKELRKRGF